MQGKARRNPVNGKRSYRHRPGANARRLRQERAWARGGSKPGDEPNPPKGADA